MTHWQITRHPPGFNRCSKETARLKKLAIWSASQGANSSLRLTFRKSIASRSIVGWSVIAMQLVLAAQVGTGLIIAPEDYINVGHWLPLFLRNGTAGRSVCTIGLPLS